MRGPTSGLGFWSRVLGVGLLLLTTRDALGAILVNFDTSNYSVAPAGTISGQIFIDGNASTETLEAVPNGLFSFGVKITFPTTDAAPASVTVDPALNFLAFTAGASTTLSSGVVAAKGNIDLSTNIPYSGTHLMNFTLNNLAGPGSHYTLTLELNRTLGPTEDVFVDGTGTALDTSITFGVASVTVTPEPATLASLALAALILLKSRRSRHFAGRASA
jgi:hypothetical protein